MNVPVIYALVLRGVRVAFCDRNSPQPGRRKLSSEVDASLVVSFVDLSRQRPTGGTVATQTAARPTQTQQTQTQQT